MVLAILIWFGAVVFLIGYVAIRNMWRGSDVPPEFPIEPDPFCADWGNECDDA